MKEVWPLVHEQAPDLQLNVFGANQTPEDAALTDESCSAYVRGFCKSVPATMKKHRLLVAPLRFGAGVKGKLLDAFRSGLVAVTTPLGAEGISAPDDFPGYIVSDGAENARSFASAVLRAYEDNKSWTVHQSAAVKLLLEKFDEGVNNLQLRNFLEERLQHLPASRESDYLGELLWHSSLRSTEWMSKYLAA